MIVNLLREARLAVEPVLHDRVATLPATMRLLAGYHFGWWDHTGTPHEGGSGKAARPALVFATARALGHDDATTVAAVVELVHNFTLIHDDVHDQDTERHGQPALWTVFGTSEALLAGNALMALGLETLPHPRLARCVIELCEGQSADIAFERRQRVSLDECLTMSARKTGVLLGCSAALAASHANADERTVQAFEDFGVELGVASQFANDLLGIWGDERVTGKPTGSDLVRLKKTLPVVHALESGTEAGARLAKLYERGTELDHEQTLEAADLVAETGARAWAEAEIHRRVGLALSFVEPTPDLTALAQLAFTYSRGLLPARIP